MALLWHELSDRLTGQKFWQIARQSRRLPHEAAPQPGIAFTSPSPRSRPSRRIGLSLENNRLTPSIPSARTVESNRRQL